MTENDDRLPLIEASGIRIRITEQGDGPTGYSSAAAFANCLSTCSCTLPGTST